MTRTVAREIAIQLSFAAQLAGDDARETADTFFSREYFATLAEEDPLFLEYPDEKQLDYIRRLTGLVYDHMYELNHMIEKYARGWRLERISRVAAAIMRCAMCEILYMDDVPNAAAINEGLYRMADFMNVDLPYSNTDEFCDYMDSDDAISL